METEFQEPFAPALWGGRIPESSKELPYRWLIYVLVYSMVIIKNFNIYIVEKLPFLIQLLESFETGDSIKGKVLWY